MRLLRPRRKFIVGGAPSGSFLSSAALSASSTVADIALGQPSEDRVIIVTASARSGQVTRMTCNGIEFRLATSAGAAGQSAFTTIWSGLVPTGLVGVFWPETAAGTSPILNIYRATGLSQYQARDAQSSATATDTVRAVDLNTTAGGIIVACAVNNIGAANSVTWTGDQTPTEDSDSAMGSGRQSAMSTFNAVADTANTITATFAVISTTQIALSGASFR